jgi:ATP-dependent DNA helicase RecG
LFIFYHQEDELDGSVIKDSGLDDISEEAVALYRNLRAKVNPFSLLRKPGFFFFFLI